MNEKIEKLVELRANLKFAEKRYEEETNEDKLTELESEITNLNTEISKVEAEMNTTEEVQTEAQEETNEEVQSTTEVQEEVQENNVQETTTEEVLRSAEWKKVDESNLNKIGSFEQRGGNTMNEEKREELKKQLEARAKSMINGENVTVSSVQVLNLEESRAVTSASEGVVLPAHQSSELATAPFKQYSSLIDLIKRRNLQGGESYEAPFTISYGEAGTTEEGKDYADVEPDFDTVKVSKVKITAYAEVSEELEKLPAADYVSEVEKCIDVAVKKKIAKEIITGTGTDHFVGIFDETANNKCVLKTDDIEVAAINGDTLNDIVFGYGGDEELEGPEHLILTKADLLAFSKVRNEVNGLKEYKIDYANQTIDGVPYVINSNCKSIAGATVGDYCMAYGNLKAYEMAVFSDIDSKKDYSYKFKQGLVAFRTSLFAGGNTTTYRGFIRIKKGTVSA